MMAGRSFLSAFSVFLSAMELGLGILSGRHLHVVDDAGYHYPRNKKDRDQVAEPGCIEGVFGNAEFAEKHYGNVEKNSGNEICE